MSWRPAQKPLGRRLGRYGLEYRYRCPKCHQDNLWWIPARGGGKCWNCAAEGDGNLTTAKMQKLFRDFSEQDELAQLVEELNATRTARPARPAPVPPAPEEEEHDYHWKARYYLERERKCALHDCKAAGVWYEEQHDRLYFPLARILGGGEPGAVPCMSRTPDARVKDWRVEPKSAQKELYWFNPTGLDSGKILFVEGPFDVLAPGLLGQAVALCGTAFYEDGETWILQHRRTLSSLWFWLDNDTAGRVATVKITQRLRRLVGRDRVKVVIYDKEPGDCSAEEAEQVLREAGYY